MEIFKTLIGNDEIKKTLGASVATSRFSHAYIIEGAPGTGKKTIATLASASIFCEDEHSRPCGKCASCKRVFGGYHTDVRFFEVTKVDQIRDIKQHLYDSPNESDYKIYILDQAQRMNVKAQNALLISLEEPPKNVVFFLLTTDAGALLETIRSRAQTLRTELLDGDIIFSQLKARAPMGMSEERLEEIVIASGGSLGYAMDLMDSGKADALFEARKNALDITMSVIKNDTDAVTLLMSYSSMAREDLKELLSLCLTVIGDLILLKKDKSAPLRFFTSRDDAIAIAQRYNLPRLISCYDALLVAISDLNMNSNTALTLMSILINSKKKGN
ncbi:MAG: hypothetical protein IJW10_04580 [Clostridia bacterium]|nr:hypothetical protein [Clostridia bacterium]